MAVRILESIDDGACLYCSTSGWAFGPHFQDAEDAQEFLNWFAVGHALAKAHELFGTVVLNGGQGLDPRGYMTADLQRLHGAWVEEREGQVSEAWRRMHEIAGGKVSETEFARMAESHSVKVDQDFDPTEGEMHSYFNGGH